MASPARKPWWRRWFGTRSERAAGRYLRHQGMRLLAWNQWTDHGEIDLVALDRGCIVFVEVRSTGTLEIARAAESVDLAKQRRLTAAALDWLRRRNLLDRPARFDVLLLSWPDGVREPRIEHHCHAFEAVGRGQMYS